MYPKPGRKISTSAKVKKTAKRRTSRINRTLKSDLKRYKNHSSKISAIKQYLKNGSNHPYNNLTIEQRRNSGNNSDGTSSTGSLQVDNENMSPTPLGFDSNSTDTNNSESEGFLTEVDSVSKLTDLFVSRNNNSANPHTMARKSVLFADDSVLEEDSIYHKHMRWSILASDKKRLNRSVLDEVDSIIDNMESGLTNGDAFDGFQPEDLGRKKSIVLKRFLQNSHGIKSCDDHSFPLPSITENLTPMIKQRKIYKPRYTNINKMSNKGIIKSKNVIPKVLNKKRTNNRSPAKNVMVIKSEENVNILENNTYSLSPTKGSGPILPKIKQEYIENINTSPVKVTRPSVNLTSPVKVVRPAVKVTVTRSNSLLPTTSPSSKKSPGRRPVPVKRAIKQEEPAIILSPKIKLTPLKSSKNEQCKNFVQSKLRKALYTGQVTEHLNDLHGNKTTKPADILSRLKSLNQDYVNRKPYNSTENGRVIKKKRRCKKACSWSNSRKNTKRKIKPVSTARVNAFVDMLPDNGLNEILENTPFQSKEFSQSFKNFLDASTQMMDIFNTAMKEHETKYVAASSDLDKSCHKLLNQIGKIGDKVEVEDMEGIIEAFDEENDARKNYQNCLQRNFGFSQQAHASLYNQMHQLLDRL